MKISAEARSRGIAWSIVLIYFVLQLAGLKSIGLTDDDDFYIPAGISYATWLFRILRFDGSAWTSAAIDAAFSVNQEHPPFAKYIFGICHFALRTWVGPTDAARIGTVLFSTLTGACLLTVARQCLGPQRGLRVGGLAVLALLTLPRFYFHSHAATLDVPVAAMVLATTALCLAAERSRAAAWAVGPVFGLAAATKLNAPFLLLAYLPFSLLLRWRQPLRTSQPSTGLVIPPLPAALFSMVLLGPLTFWVVWPWLWHAPIQRISDYLAFHIHHYGIFFLYFGRIYSTGPFAPWHAPFVLAATTIPIATSLLALAGCGFAIGPIAVRLRGEALSGERPEAELVLLAILGAATSIGVVAFAGTPIYGGEKLFMPFFPYICWLAGYGADALYRRLRIVWPDRGGRIGSALVVLVAAGSGAALELKFGAYGLSEYNGLINGLRGATAAGLERQYYDVAYRDLVAWLSKAAPEGTKIHFLPNNWEYQRTYRWYREAGELRRDLSVAQTEEQADWLVITHERRFARYGDDLARYRGQPVLRERRIDGTPVWTVIELHRGHSPQRTQGP